MTLTLLLMFGLKQPALGLSLPQHRLWAGCRFASLSMLARRSRRRGPAAVPRPPRVLQRSDSGVPEIAACHPEQYDKLLSSKVASMVQLVTGAVAAGSSSASEPQTTELPAIEVFESARTNFRMRASFQIWREGAGLHYVMFNRGDSRTPHEASEELRDKLNDVRLLTTSTGDALVTVTYNRPIGGGAWEAAARELAEALGVCVVGRSRKVVIGCETVEERLSVPGRGECVYLQTEGAFTQPNAQVCSAMLGWAVDATRGLDGSRSELDCGDGRTGSDLCELYCGNGCFTVALAPNFRRVAAARGLPKAGHVHANGVSNTRVARLSAEEFVEALAGGRPFRRLDEAGVELASWHMLLVDPPRAGLDQTSRALAATFARVVYVSCNPETLARDLAQLSATHTLTRLAAFDQFPYTPHLECGVVLERRPARPAAAGGGGAEDETPAPSSETPALPCEAEAAARHLKVGGEAARLEAFGPVVVGESGQLRYIANWESMSEGERSAAQELLAKRNAARLKRLRGGAFRAAPPRRSALAAAAAAALPSRPLWAAECGGASQRACGEGPPEGSGEGREPWQRQPWAKPAFAAVGLLSLFHGLLPAPKPPPARGGGPRSPPPRLSLDEPPPRASRRDATSTTAALLSCALLAPSMPRASSAAECDEACARRIAERRALFEQSRTTADRSVILELSRQRAALYNTTFRGASCVPGLPCY
ncbi:hypothetical protein EMIHUDRAFT_98494 [Emiliania huxleyi CCMP1516]|uniref:tRNA (Uracil-5-)-methyltransferase n=2 Tax=Emiliania huxleyi TaxID=2903 RepID=A0A0D3KI87_EMIH1|nr:hypothetical protein EMIHUDRAFT_98494 [Emiliania huxleyi CCMP1516]EOD35472.1 hypothetical protein EMIHUDRAFT_98494 [Emiliania huxleyi CCMP1516]|eukprot:XP_005787901.1 hypothetical protein EMIHUDRAFT_98494 [Emiliania huxleyi CCMP1516]